MLSRDCSALVLCGAPLAPLTTFGIGGPADVLVIPGSVRDVQVVIAGCRGRGVPLYLMGAGSNVIVPDEGVRGVVLRVGSSEPVCGFQAGPAAVPRPLPADADVCCRGLARLEMAGDTIIAGAGVADDRLAHFALANRVTGYEWIYDIPGSVGGALFMNAGNNDGEMRGCVLSVRWIDPDGELHESSATELALGYRTSRFHKEPGLVVEVTLRADTCGDPAAIHAKMDAIRETRRRKFPEEPRCAGSVFKRPPGHFAGKLIEDAGLGGRRIGGAMVAHKHKGFIVNTGRATAADVLALIDLVRTEVQARSGIVLEAEVQLLTARRFA